VLQALGHADCVNQYEAYFLFGARRHLAQLRRRDRACAAALHLLEIERRFHVAQKDQHLQRFNIGSGGDHIDGDGDPRVVVGAELTDQLLGVLRLRLIGDFFCEIVALTEDLTGNADYVLGMMVVFAEDQRLRHLVAAGEQFREQAVAIGFEHGADLVRHDHRAVDFLRGIGEVLVEFLVALGPRALVADRDLIAFRDRAAVLADIGADAKDLVGYVDPVRHGALVRILRDEVAAEKPHRVQ